jgi:hypothetical protein
MSPNSMFPFPDPADLPSRLPQHADFAASLPSAADHWLDDALRTVPLPDGFLDRVRLFTLASTAGPHSAELGITSGRVHDATRRPSKF